MTHQEISNAKDHDLIGSFAAIKRAAIFARQVAMQTGTAIIVCKDKVIVRRTAEELAIEKSETKPN